MELELYQRVVITQDFPDQILRKGDLAWLIEFVDRPNGGEKGAILELFNVFGEHYSVVIVPAGAISALSADLIPTARHPETR